MLHVYDFKLGSGAYVASGNTRLEPGSKQVSTDATISNIIIINQAYILRTWRIFVSFFNRIVAAWLTLSTPA